MIPDSQKAHNDVIDFIADACQIVEEVETPDGRIEKQLMIDPEKAYWKTHKVNSPTFARFVFELKNFQSLAIQCFNRMSRERAVVLARQIMDQTLNFKYSIDAKSSESLRDKNNTQMTLIDTLIKNKIERAYTVKDEAKKSFWQGMVGKDAERDAENG